MKRFALLLVAAALAGCGHSSATRIWTVDAIAPPSAPSRAMPSAPIRVDAVHVPLALDRLEVVDQARDRVMVHDFDRWSSPLGEVLRVALTRDLIARLPAGSVIFPNAPKPIGTRSLVVDVLDLRPTSEGWTMDVSWTITGAAKSSPTRNQQRFTFPALGTSVADQATALGHMLAELADRLAETR